MADSEAGRERVRLLQRRVAASEGWITCDPQHVLVMLRLAPPGERYDWCPRILTWGMLGTR